MSDVAELEKIDTKDLDSIHTLPIVALPVQHPGLRRTRLIKNVRMETQIEMFSGQEFGSGQISIEDVAQHFEGGEALRADIKLLSGLAGLPSFDCYTLRRGLRHLDITVEREDIFKLSEKKAQELFPFMRRITRPLVVHLYGSDEIDVSDTESLLERVRNPDLDLVRPKIEQMARILGVPIPKLPDYLEDFGDLYLSVSYFESLFESIGPTIDQMLVWAKDVADGSHLRNDPTAQKTFSQTDRGIRYLKDNLEQRFKLLTGVTLIDWENLNLSAFQRAQKGIRSHQAYLASGLCGLAVKIYEWERRFPNAGGSPDRCFEFVSSDLRPGLEHLLRSLPKIETEDQKTAGSARGGRVWN